MRIIGMTSDSESVQPRDMIFERAPIRTCLLSLVMWFFFVPAQAAPVIEVLWDQHEPGDHTRSEAMMLAREAPDPAVCWKSDQIHERTEVTWRVLDADGQLVYEDRYRQDPVEGMAVSCRPVDLTDEQAEYGIWQYRLYFDGDLVAEHSLEVVKQLADWSRYDQGYFPYVRGRTNYRPDIRDDYRGEFRIALTVDAEGEVVDVELVESTNATELSRQMVRDSAYLFRFPSDPDRQETPLVIHQPVTLRPE